MFGFQSGYTTLKNAIHLDDLINEMKNSSFHFLAYADDNLSVMHKIYTSFLNTDKKIIVGLDTKIKLNENIYNVLIYPLNEKGQLNLLEISYIYQSNKILLYDEFQLYNKELLVIIKTQKFFNNNLIVNEQVLKDIQDFLLQNNNTFLGIDLPNQLDNEYNQLKNFSSMIKIKIIPLHITKYLLQEDEIVYQTLLKIGNNNKNNTSNRHFISEREFINYCSLDEELLITLKETIKKIEFNYSYPKFAMPKPPTEIKAESKIYLSELSKFGLSQRLKKNAVVEQLHEQYKKRLNEELEVIIQMGFSEYFLIVYDFVKWAKQNNILVGPGRGSAAGSLVSYCLGITDVDPIKYGLLFERFLNKERITMPDIDIDFPDYKRESVIEYVGKTYGKNHVASIQTFQTFALKSSVRDVSKVIDIDKTRIEGIINSVLKQEIDESDTDVVLLNAISKKIEGLPRQTGTHAAGIILSNENLREAIPLQEGQFLFPQTQYEAKDLEEMGLLKIDFLGIKNLSIIEDVVELVKTKNPKFNLNTIDLNDNKTFYLLKNADTDGIFQLESSGIKQVLKKMSLDHFEDLVAVLALYRPGPMDSIDLYIDRKKNGYKEILYPEIEEILKPTYGIIVYQEQIMQIANRYAGFTLAEADLLRRGISKKDVHILKEQEDLFIKKAKQLGRDTDRAKEIYNLILKFADYGFNRSHSVSYAVVSYQMAYLKANYYLEFMTVLLSNSIGNEKQIYQYIQELKRRKIKMFNPCIIDSKTTFKLYDNGLIMPINSIKGISSKTAQNIISLQDRFDLNNFLETRKILKDVVNEKQFESLVFAGAFRKYNLTQKTQIYYKDLNLIGYNAYIDDFEPMKLPEYSLEELCNNEKSALGFNNLYDFFQIYKINNKKKYDLFSSQKTNLLIFAKLEKIKTITTKKGDKMAFIFLNDSFQEVEVIVFPQVYNIVSNKLKNGYFEVKIRQNIYKKTIKYELIDIIQVNL